MNKNILLIGSFLGLLSVLFGAFGAHLLEDHLFWANRIETYELAVRYQFFHVFFILFVGFFYNSFDVNYIKYSFYFCLVGVILFSGSLYTLCMTNISYFAYITPFGGIFLSISWFLFIMCVIKIKN